MEDDDLWWRRPLETQTSSTTSAEMAPLRNSAIKLETGLPYITPEPEHDPYAPIFLLDGNGVAPVIEPEPEDYTHAPYFGSDNLLHPKGGRHPLIKSEGFGTSIEQEVDDFVNSLDPRYGFSVVRSPLVDEKEYLDAKDFYSGPSDGIENEQNEEKELTSSTLQLPLRSLGFYPKFET